MPDEFEGYCINDITYCVDPHSKEFFPVRVIKIGRRFVDVVSRDDDSAAAVAPKFAEDKKNRRFMRPKLSKLARFGGCDERTVNRERISGQELRLLPCHYATFTNKSIRQRNAKDPTRWPLPTGVVFERWFKDSES